MTAAGSTSRARRLFHFTLFYFITLIILFFLYTAETFLKVVFAILRCSVLFSFLKISVIALLTNQLFLVFVAFSVPWTKSWTFLSRPVSHGVCSQFVSYVSC